MVVPGEVRGGPAAWRMRSPGDQSLPKLKVEGVSNTASIFPLHLRLFDRAIYCYCYFFFRLGVVCLSECGGENIFFF